MLPFIFNGPVIRLGRLYWWLSGKKNPPANAGDVGLIPGSVRSPREEMETHSSILAWEIPQTEEPGRGLKRVRHNLATKQQQQLC